MALTTQVLGDSVGIQWAGLQDKTVTTPTTGATEALIVGEFRRGRIDRPMRITRENVRSTLGYEPDNPFYQAVNNALAIFSFVNVLRIGTVEFG